MRQESRSATRAVILAGGSGSRLWPLSRQQMPKQFLRFSGESPLMQATIERLQPLVGPSDILIVTSEEHAKGEAYHALLPYRLILEPVARNTAPAIAIAAAFLKDYECDPVMLVLPADHIVKDPVALRARLAQAINAARDGALVTFGIRPTRAETGFGYIKVADHERVATNDQPPVLPVERFIEKPDPDTAERFLREAGYYWNSGIFVWRASSILAQVELHLPEIHAILEEMRAAWKGGDSFAQVIKRNFHRMPAISIDHGVLERAAGILLIPCDIGWSDVGSWDAFYDIFSHDECGNAIQGNVLAVDCARSLLYSGKRLVAAVGLDGVCVVETADAVLISRRGQTQRVREVVDRLNLRHARERLVHLTVQRPWGTYTVLEDEKTGYKIKRIEITPGARLSLQKHQRRSEHWVVVSGTATVTRGEETIEVAKNESAYIPVGVLHRLENRGTMPLQIIEVQVGEYLEEDDIERFDDSYGRG